MHSIKDIVELSKENPIIFSYYSLYKKEKLTLDEALIGMIKMLNCVINENIVIRRIDLITVEYMKDANGEIIIFLKKGDLSSSISLGEAVSLRDQLIKLIEKLQKENENHS